MQHADAQVMDEGKFVTVTVDQLEIRNNDSGANILNWDTQGWYGGGRDKQWVKTEGASTTSSTKEGDAELQLLYSRMILPFWGVQFGVRPI